MSNETHFMYDVKKEAIVPREWVEENLNLSLLIIFPFCLIVSLTPD